MLKIKIRSPHPGPSIYTLYSHTKDPGHIHTHLIKIKLNEKQFNKNQKLLIIFVID